MNEKENYLKKLKYFINKMNILIFILILILAVFVTILEFGYNVILVIHNPKKDLSRFEYFKKLTIDSITRWFLIGLD